jgi:hypothetical protein
VLYFTSYGNGGGESEIQISSSGAVNEFFLAKSYVGLSNITFRAGL